MMVPAVAVCCGVRTELVYGDESAVLSVGMETGLQYGDWVWFLICSTEKGYGDCVAVLSLCMMTGAQY
eukprot:2817583-Rhodomonas_salina.1